MPPKRKAKKGSLSDEQIKATVDLVKQYWPNYDISPSNIRQPTREFMLNFYTECVNNLEEKCAYVTNSRIKLEPPGLSHELLLFLKLSRIPTLKDANFKLGDLYNFEPKRVNSHIFVTMHFLHSTESAMDDMVRISHSVFKVKETVSKNEEELKLLKEHKTQLQISITLAKSENKKLKEAAALMVPQYEQTLASIEETNKKCKDLDLEAEKLRSALENNQEELEKHEKTKLHLQKQTVTDEEYRQLKSKLESLKIDEQNLEEIDLHNGLLNQNQDIELLEQCLQRLGRLDWPEELLKLSDLRVQLTKEQQDLEYAVALKQDRESELKQLKVKLEQKKHLAQIENQQLHETVRKNVENFTTKEAELREQHKRAAKTDLSVIENLQIDINRITADMDLMKSELQAKYSRMCKMQNDMLDEFKLFLDKIKNLKQM